ncbi:hypothetical protein [Nocardia sp. NPDC004711]
MLQQNLFDARTDASSDFISLDFNYRQRESSQEPTGSATPPLIPNDPARQASGIAWELLADWVIVDNPTTGDGRPTPSADGLW